MSPVDMGKISKKYAGSWIALEEGRTRPVASGKTIDEVIKASKKKGFSQPVLTKIPTDNLGYIL